MEVTESEINKLVISGVERLDAITVILHEFVAWEKNRSGTIIITCYGKAWTATWGSMGTGLIEFFLGCDEHYIAKNLDSHLEGDVVDTDKLNDMAEESGLNYGRDDPQNDHEMLAGLFGSDCSEWWYQMPKKSNHKYEYLCRIIKTVQSALQVVKNRNVINDH